MKRLADDPQAPAPLRAMIAAARSDAPGPAALDRVLANVERTGPAPRGGGAGRLLLVAGGAGVAVLIAFVLLRGGGSDDDERDDRAPPPSPPPAAAAATRSAPPVVSPLPDQAPPAAPQPAPRAQRRPPPKAPPAPATTPAPHQSEVSMVERARAALAARDFAAALAAAAAHLASYPDGVLSEEREAIAVEALAGAGRREAARGRLDRFLRRFPASSYRRHLEEVAR